MQDDVKKKLSQLGIKAAKKLGQHFLLEPAIAERMALYAALKNDDVVLEIGPGLGLLTETLLRKCSKVIAVERDKKLCALLNKKFSSEIASERLRLVCGDALKVNVPKYNKIVSNLPFNISSAITFHILSKKFDCAVLTYQKEFAERLVASPNTPKYSRLTVNVYYRARCEILDIIPRELFYPKPLVESAVIRLSPRAKPPLNLIDEKIFFRLVDVLFQHRRKKIENALQFVNNDFQPKKIKNLPFAARRIGELSPEEIGELSNWLAKLSFNSSIHDYELSSCSLR